MRDILFKAKTVDNNDWIEGDYISNYDEGCILPFGTDSFDEYEFVDPKTVCQYTGFKDIDGKKIFEGDIIGDWTETDEGLKQSKQQVFWNEKYGCWKLDDSFSQNKSNCQDLWLELHDYKFEIIGNIHDKN
jgi:uncharacterized phage protein (TIGR01671 family)